LDANTSGMVATGIFPKAQVVLRDDGGPVTFEVGPITLRTCQALHVFMRNFNNSKGSRLNMLGQVVGKMREGEGLILTTQITEMERNGPPNIMSHPQGALEVLLAMEGGADAFVEAVLVQSAPPGIDKDRVKSLALTVTPDVFETIKKAATNVHMNLEVRPEATEMVLTDRAGLGRLVTHIIRVTMPGQAAPANEIIDALEAVDLDTVGAVVKVGIGYSGRVEAPKVEVEYQPPDSST
jgi:hypothetical protein